MTFEGHQQCSHLMYQYSYLTSYLAMFYCCRHCYAKPICTGGQRPGRESSSGSRGLQRQPWYSYHRSLQIASVTVIPTSGI